MVQLLNSHSLLLVYEIVTNKIFVFYITVGALSRKNVLRLQFHPSCADACIDRLGGIHFWMDSFWIAFACRRYVLAINNQILNLKFVCWPLYVSYDLLQAH